ncbi:hypothetical protein Tco_0894617 [Tanacetum coccineum]|uniref:Uncharacterized protein n=1 Tax=Tanacetum coccineum TaxID=301880 RepID=A0ABQ5CCM5_9ASTR
MKSLNMKLPSIVELLEQRFVAIVGYKEKMWGMNRIDIGGDVVDLTGDEDLTDEDGDIGMGDSTGASASLGGEIFSGGKKSWESNIGGDSEDKRSLVKSSEKLGEVFPGEARE